MPHPRPTLAEIVARAEATGATIGVSASGPGGARYAHNAGRRFFAASTVKIPIMVELFRQQEAGRLNLDDTHALRPDDKANGTGVLARLHDGLALTLGDLVFLMMSISDNTATNILIDRVGMEQVGETMRRLGMPGSNLDRRMYGRPAKEGEPQNWAVPADYARAVAALLDGTAASSASCEAMVALLERQQNDRRIARHLPAEDRPRWGSKTGTLPGVVNDVGFVMTPRGPAVIAVFCEGMADPHSAEALIGDVARAVLEGSEAG